MTCVCFRERSFLLLFVSLALAVGGISPASAQSLLAGRGLGLVVEPLDARARGLGGVALGLPEPSLSLLNPAGVAGIPAPALHVTYQPDRVSTEWANRTFTATTARFPVVQVGLPIGPRFVLALGYGSLLDRNWAVQRDTTMLIGEDTVAIVDRFASRGGVARIRAGGAYSFGERLAVGVGVDVYTGAARDSVSRAFDSATLQPVRFGSLWTYSGIGVTAGVRWVPSAARAPAASVGSGGTLEAESADTLQRVVRSYSLPMNLGLGASGRITANTVLALSGRWSGWSAADQELTGVGGARDTWTVSGGVEWDALSVGEQVIPFRIGARYATLPFRWQGAGEEGWLDERALTAGLGLMLAGGAARTDLALERGSRGGEGAGISESFWRMAISLTVLGR